MDRGSRRVLLAGTMLGIISIFIHRLSKCGLSPIQISAVRIILSGVIYTVYLFFYDKQQFLIRPKDLWMFLGSGVLGLMAFSSLYIFTAARGGAAVAVVLIYLAPAIVMVLSVWFFKEKITPVKLAAMGLSFIGCLFVSGLVGGSQRMDMIILGTGILSAFCYAFYTIFCRIALKHYSSMTLTVYTFIFAAFAMLLVIDPKQTASLIVADPHLIIWCMGISLICCVIPFFLYNIGLQELDAFRAAVFITAEPIVGACTGMIVFHEDHGTLKILGILLILAAVVLLNLYGSPKD